MIKSLHYFLRISSIGILFITSFSWSQSIWTNPIDDTAPSTHNPYTIGDVKDAHITISGIGYGSGLSNNAGSGRYNTKGWTSATSLDTDDYFTFTLTPNAGYKINFSGLDFTLQRSNTGPESFALRSSVDNYSSNIQVITASGTTASAKTMSLSNTSFQNVSGAVTFRLYGYNSGGGAGTASINDFTFNGQVINSLDSVDNEKIKLNFYPNPVTDILHLVSEDAIISVEVYNLNGQLILSEKSEIGIDQIDFSMLPQSIYYIKASSLKGYSTINIIRQ